jgi:hypothetical protein
VDNAGNESGKTSDVSATPDGTAPTMTIATTLAINPEVSTLAGSGSAGSADEQARQHHFIILMA